MPPRALAARVAPRAAVCEYETCRRPFTGPPKQRNCTKKCQQAAAHLRRVKGRALKQARSDRDLLTTASRSFHRGEVQVLTDLGSGDLVIRVPRAMFSELAEPLPTPEEAVELSGMLRCWIRGVSKEEPGEEE
jgi:hypothetical protein